MKVALTPEQFAELAAKLMLAEQHAADAMKILESASGIPLRELATQHRGEAA